MKQISKDFMYCKGIGCPLRECCVRYTEGNKLPEGNWWWMNDCGESHEQYLPVSNQKQESHV